MLIDGKTIAQNIQQDLKDRLAGCGVTPTLHIVSMGSHPAIDQFIDMKKQFGGVIGVAVEHVQFAEDIQEDELLSELKRYINTIRDFDGVIVQLPIPSGLDIDVIYRVIDAQHDVDVLKEETFHAFLSRETSFVPPVLGALQTIVKEHNISWHNQNVVVVGNGRLVGKPVSRWMTSQGITHKIITREIAPDIKERLIKNGDIIISGAGVPHMITPEMIKSDVILVDAGTSSMAGRLRGDIDPTCHEKTSLMTPTPGGVGPLTVATLFSNIVSRIC